jgi:hypothetical protein
VEGVPVMFRKQAEKLDLTSGTSKAHANQLIESHDILLESSLEKGSYNKLYSFKHIVNGFAVHTTPQAKRLRKVDGVKMVEKDRGAKLMTTYTPNSWDYQN